ncbi:MAG: DNA-3-methyladenine glycosylase I, partial [Actinomycetota bacterium]
MDAQARRHRVHILIEKIHTYEDGLTRCHWPKQNREYLDYHDKEWGVEVRDDEELFEHLS